MHNGVVVHKMEAQTKKILVIDDNLGVLFAFRAALESDGYEVVVSERYEGIESVAKCAPQLIFLDVFLAAQDGRAITRDLKASTLTAHIPVVVVSAYPGIKQFALEAGADGYLSKPFRLGELLAVTKKHVT